MGMHSCIRGCHKARELDYLPAAHVTRRIIAPRVQMRELLYDMKPDADWARLFFFFLALARELSRGLSWVNKPQLGAGCVVTLFW